MAAGHFSFHETKYERDGVFLFFFFPSFFRPQMEILIGAVLWECDNGGQAINLNLKRSVLPSFCLNHFTEIDVNNLTFTFFSSSFL